MPTITNKENILFIFTPRLILNEMKQAMQEIITEAQ